MSADIGSILAAGLQRGALTAEQWQTLTRWELRAPDQAQAWGITTETVTSTVEERFGWLQRLWPEIGQMPLPMAPPNSYLLFFWQLWLPLALRLRHFHQDLDRPLIYGLLGGQGTGKTTLSNILRYILAAMDFTMVGFSIDDIYKTYAERQRLRQHDPRLIWRGPPGTHDIDLGVATLEQVRRGETPIKFPRFDKSCHQGEGDRSQPETVANVDIVLFEGWFLGVRPLQEMDWQQAPWPIVDQADRQFAQDMNHQLRSYLPLWRQVDQLMVLIPEDYRLSQQWRLQAEQQMKLQGRAGMTDEAVVAFVQYFWKALHPELFITPLKQSRWTDLVVEIDVDRRPVAIYSPKMKFS